MKRTDPITATWPHVMLDVETLDNLPTAAIVSVGAVLFDPAVKPAPQVALGPRFYRAIHSGERQTALGFTVDRETVAWWDKQSEAARAVFTDPDRVDITDAMIDLRDWLRAARQQNAEAFNAAGPHSRHEMSTFKLLTAWSHGASFDLPIVDHAFAATSVGPFPVPFYRWRCTRTLYELAGVDVGTYRDPSTHHNALEDAEAQARAAIASLNRLRAHKDRAAEWVDYQARSFNERPTFVPHFPRDEVAA